MIQVSIIFAPSATIMADEMMAIFSAIPIQKTSVATIELHVTSENLPILPTQQQSGGLCLCLKASTTGVRDGTRQTGFHCNIQS